MVLPSTGELASGSKDKTVKIWNSENGSLLHSIGGHVSEVSSCAISPLNLAQLVSVTDDGVVYFWNISGREKERARGEKTS